MIWSAVLAIAAAIWTVMSVLGVSAIAASAFNNVGVSVKHDFTDTPLLYGACIKMDVLNVLQKPGVNNSV